MSPNASFYDNTEEFARYANSIRKPNTSISNDYYSYNDSYSGFSVTSSPGCVWHPNSTCLG
jgi:hypothetical protein